MAKHKHMDLKERYVIEHSLDDSLSFKAIGLDLGRDCTTISKEVKGHRVFEKKGAYGRPFNNCINRFGCKKTDLCPNCSGIKRNKCSFCGKCCSYCNEYKMEVCPRLAKPPYVCNGCPDRNKCTLEKAFYYAVSAQYEYEHLLSESRTGYNITEEAIANMDAVVSPLLKSGQSIHHIIATHQDEVMCCEKSLYNYVNDGLFKARNIDMPRKVRLRPRKGKKSELKVDKKCRVGRTYQDYLAYCAENPDLPVTEIDTVEGERSGACLLTIYFVSAKLQLAFKREANTARSVSEIFNCLYQILGADAFCRLFPIILADNGSEFSDPEAIEFDGNGNRRTRLFYCDASAPYQKGACENNHEMIRRIIPKGKDFGQFSDEQIRLMMSHINSYGRNALGEKSPLEMFSFLYGEDILTKLNLQCIPRDEIIITPALLKSSTQIASVAESTDLV